MKARDLAELLGVHHNTITNYMHRAEHSDPTVLKELARHRKEIKALILGDESQST